MARTIQEIYNQFTDSYIAQRALAGLVYDNPANWSKVSLKRLFYYTLAFCHQVMERIFDEHVVLIDEKIANLKPGLLAWYRQKALDFQLGGTLFLDTDVYNNSGLTEAQVLAQKIIVQAAATLEDGVIKIKVVKAGLTPLSPTEMAAFVNYIDQCVQYAGDDIVYVSADPDKVKASITVYFNPQLMKPNGDLFDGTVRPVETAAVNFFSSIGFNGKYFLSKHQDAIQAVKGVTDVKINAVQVTGADVINWVDVDMQYQPVSGVMKFYTVSTNPLTTDLLITYVPQH